MIGRSLRLNGEGVLGLWLELIESDDVTSLRGGGEGVVFKLGGGLEYKGGDEVVGGRERNNDLIGGKRSDEWLSKNLICGNTGVLRKGEVAEGKGENTDS